MIVFRRRLLIPTTTRTVVPYYYDTYWPRQLRLYPDKSRQWNTVNSNRRHHDDEFVDPIVSQYLSRWHIPSNIHSSIVRALTPVYGKPLTLAHLQSFGKEGMEALSKSIQESSQHDNTNAHELPTIITIDIPHHKTQHTLQWQQSVSLLQLCKHHFELFGEYMEGTCGGTMSCCTCHVYLSPAMYEALPEPTDAELDMLDLAFQVKSTSRLACQVYINDDILKLDEEHVKVTIPEDVVDLWS